MTARHECHQVWLYLAAIGGGLVLGAAQPAWGEILEPAVWPTLGMLLYVTFTQVPLAHLPAAARDTRFVAVVLVGNFVIMPAVVWALLPLASDDPAVRLGVVLVLVVPCTDWYLAFTHLAGGDTRRALAVTPVNLVVQLLLLPVYVHLFLGERVTDLVGARDAALVFATLIAAPLAAAWATQRHARRSSAPGRLPERLGRLSVPLVAAVVFLVAASQSPTVTGSLDVLLRPAAIFVAFLVAALAVGRALAAAARLAPAASRALIFSVGTRNSFVVLPFALALGDPWSATVIVVVLQSLVELFAMTAYLRVVPALTPERDRT